MDFRNIRLNYEKSKIDFSDLKDNPVDFFSIWLEDAFSINKNEANACVLSTVSTDLKPSSRVVLLKDLKKSCLIFFTNYSSKKSIDISINNQVSINFYWPELERQVRITGQAQKVSVKESDDYFSGRPRESQIGAWLSSQSRSIDLDHDFKEDLKDLEERFDGKEVDRPIDWGGYSVRPFTFEFWQGRPSRLHDRLLYEFDGKYWNKKRLAP